MPGFKLKPTQTVCWSRARRGRSPAWRARGAEPRWMRWCASSQLWEKRD